MPAKKPYWLSQKDCGLLIGLIHHGDKIHLSEHEKHRLSDELFRHLYSQPRRRSSILQTWAYPDMHRLVNGVAIWQVPLGKRFSVRTASKMIKEILDKVGDHHSAIALHSGYYEWLHKRTPQELRAVCGMEKPRRRRGLPNALIRKITTW